MRRVLLTLRSPFPERIWILSCLLLWVTAPELSAVGSPIPADMAHGHVAGVALGFDPTFTVGLSYAYIARAFGRPLVVEGELSVPLALVPDRDHATTRAGAALLAAPETSAWNAWIGAGLDHTTGKTGVSREHSVGVYLAATPGYFGKRWYAGPTFRYRKTLLTHRTHTSWYRKVYPGVADGWYANNTGFYVLGVAAGARVTPNLAVSVVAGYKLSDDLQSYDPFIVPVSAELSIRYRFLHGSACAVHRSPD